MSKPSKKYYDYSLLLIIIILTIFGLMMIYSASSYTAQIQNHDPYFYIKKQAMIAGAGFAAMIVISLLDYHMLLNFSFLVYGVSMALMVLTMFFGKEINGKRRWIDIAGIQFQPTEIVKIAVIMILTFLIVKMGQAINEKKNLFILIGVDLLAAALVASNNLSSGIIIAGIGFVMLYTSTKKSWIYPALLVAAILLFIFAEPICTGLYQIGLLQPYQYSRVLVWKEPEAHPLDGGYQVLQGLYAIGSGGITGKGLGESIQKLGFVPEAQNDMIFSIICEELGFFGALIVILMFGFLLYRLFVIASSAPDKPGALICIGVMAHIAIQVILNIAVVCNVIPNTGITLPFISYGGTSVLLLMCEMGLVLSVSRQIELKEPS